MGGENFPARGTEDVSGVFVDHIAALRQHAAFRHSIVVIIIESNLPMIADSVRRQLEQRGVGRCCLMAQDRKRQRDGTAVMRTGTRMTRGKPAEIAHALSQQLAQRAIRFATPFTVVHKSAVDIGVREKIVRELRCFKRVISPPTATSRHRHFEATYVGKDNSGNPMTTDYIDALGHTFLEREVFRSSPSYQAYRVHGTDF